MTRTIPAFIAGAPPFARCMRPTRAVVRFVALLAAFSGLFAAAVLSAGHVLELPLPCGGSNGCNAVAAHPSSKLFGVPIAFFGVAAFLVQAVFLARPIVDRRRLLAASMLAGAGTLISAALMAYSQTVIRATCPWCVASGVAMAAVFILELRLLRSAAPLAASRRSAVWTLALMSALALGIYAGRMQRAATAPPIPPELMAKLNTHELDDPLKSIGPSSAAVTVVAFADLLCPACRTAMSTLLQYQEAHPTDVRIVYRHQPLWQLRGHETSKAAAALGEMAAERNAFWTFAGAVHAHGAQPTRETYLELMRGLGFESAAVEARLAHADDSALRNVERDIALAERLGIRSTPTFIVKVGTFPPVAANQRNLPRVLNSPTVNSMLGQRGARTTAPVLSAAAAPHPRP